MAIAPHSVTASGLLVTNVQVPHEDIAVLPTPIVYSSQGQLVHLERIATKRAEQTFRYRSAIAAALGVALGCGGRSESQREESCGVVNAAIQCACPDGRLGAQVCGADGRLGECVCTGLTGPDQSYASGGSAKTSSAFGGSLTGGTVATRIATGGIDYGGQPSPSGGTRALGGGGTPGTTATEVGGGSGGVATGCEPGARQGCDCPASGRGLRICHPSGDFGDCVCASVATSGAAGSAGGGAGGSSVGYAGFTASVAGSSARGCDASTCPNPLVENTEAFNDGVYRVGTTTGSTCGGDALQRIWPTLDSRYYHGFDCQARYYTFRQSDWALVYYTTSRGLLLDIAGNKDNPVVTPPCEWVRPRVGFDAVGTKHYVCNQTLYRAEAEAIRGSVADLVAVLADGRTIVTTSDQDGAKTDYIAVARDGTELSRLRADEEMTGGVTLAVDAATVNGNRAYVAVLREFGVGEREIFAYRLDENSHWQFIRRIAIAGTRFGPWQLVLSDGTIIVHSYVTDVFADDFFDAHLLDGTVHRLTVRSATGTSIGDRASQILVGPRVPSGTSVVN